MRFAEGAAQTTEPSSPPSDLHYLTHFLKVHFGCFGRHHNQLQEILNGISLARRSSRMFIPSPFVPVLMLLRLKLSPESVCGWNAPRTNGYYCALPYAQAQSVLQHLRNRDWC
ncbi:phosphoglycan beta 1,2 arabinosyltransferase [Leishmania guyanensis]